VAIRENSWIIKNQGLAFGQVRTRIDTDYTDLHELGFPVFKFVDNNKPKLAFGHVKKRINTECTGLINIGRQIEY
jgi:hypothetical protein